MVVTELIEGLGTNFPPIFSISLVHNILLEFDLIFSYFPTDNRLIYTYFHLSYDVTVIQWITSCHK